MDTTITTEPAGKRARSSSVVLTDRMCEKRVAKRMKFYDRKCPGLYVSITTAGLATFSFKFTDPTTGKQRTGWLGVYNPETFRVEDARSKVYGLKGMVAIVFVVLVTIVMYLNPLPGSVPYPPEAPASSLVWGVIALVAGFFCAVLVAISAR